MPTCLKQNKNISMTIILITLEHAECLTTAKNKNATFSLMLWDSIERMRLFPLFNRNYFSSMFRLKSFILKVMHLLALSSLLLV